jgi:dTDP-L-rhamnose 4-epimerase
MPLRHIQRPTREAELLVDQRVLITGGAGFIGCAVAQRLVAEGRDVVVVDSLHPQVHKGYGRPGRLPDSVPLFPFDVTSSTAWDGLLKIERPSVVIHLAAETGTGQSLRHATSHGSVNVVGTTQMLDVMSRNDHVPEHILLASSRAVYGEGAWEAQGKPYYPSPRTHGDLSQGIWDPRSPDGADGTPLPSRADWTRTEPTNIYAATKLAQEHILKAWGAAMECPVSVLRLQNVYGVGQSLDNPYTGVLSTFARLALSGSSLNVYEDGNIVRDFVYVDDVADAICSAIDRPPTVNRTLDIGSGSPTTIFNVATQIAGLCGAPAPTVTGAFRDGDVRAASTSIDAAHRDLGYTPAWTLDKGLEALLLGARTELGDM